MAQEPDLLITAGFSDKQLSAESQKVIAQFRKRGEEAQKAFQDASGRVTNRQAYRAHERELDRLAKAYDPVYRASKRYEAEVKRLDRALKLGAITSRQYAQHIAHASREMNAATRMGHGIGDFGQRAARSLAAPIAAITAALGTRQLVNMTAQWTDMQASLELATGSSEQAAAVMDRLSGVARRTMSDLGDTVQGYLGFATTLRELGLSVDEQVDFVESVGTALDVSGAKGEKAARMMETMAKAMALGELRGQNLNTILQDGGRLTEALAESMGVTTIELRALGMQGKIGRREMLGITTQLEKLRREAEGMPTTIKDGFTVLNNALLEYVGRGDEAVGMSRRIGEALEIIADNFDTVADAGLKLAAVFAAALLGRSITGMVATLGTATGALIKFASAVRAASTIGSLSTAMAGLSAAAGPLGMVLGGLVAGGVILYSDRAREAEQRSEDLRSELEKMGLYSRDVADDLEDMADALDGIGSDDQLARIRKLREDLEGLRGRPDRGLFDWVLPDLSEIGKIASELEFQGKRIFAIGESGSVAREAASIAREYQRAIISAEEFRRKVEGIDPSGASAKVQDMVARLLDAARAAEGAEIALISMGESIDSIDRANDTLDAMLERFDDMVNLLGLDTNIVDQVENIIDAMREGETSAEDAHQAILDLGEANPSFAGTLEAIGTVIGRLADLAAAARAAKRELPGIEDDGFIGPTIPRGIMAQREFADAQRQRNALSREEMDIARRMESLRREAAKQEVEMTDELLRQLAIEEAAADARRAAEGRSSRGGGGGRKASTGRAKKSEPGLFENIERDLLNLEREISLIGESTAEVAKARAEWALLDEVKKRGIPVTAELTAQIEAQAQQLAELTEELERGEVAQQSFEQAIDGIADAFAGALVAGESLREGLAQVFKQIVADLMRSRLIDMLGSIAGAMGLGGSVRGHDVLSGALRGTGAFAEGGYTGPGGKYEPAGVVHRGEYVFDQAAVRAAGGPAALEAMRQSLKRGYANGGYVGPSIPSRATRGAGGGSEAPVINIEVHNSMPGANVRGERQPDGNISLFVEQAVKNTFASGKMHGMMRQVYGVVPRAAGG